MAGADGRASPSCRRSPSPPHKRTRWDLDHDRDPPPFPARIPSPTSSPTYPSYIPSNPGGSPDDDHLSPTPVSIDRTRCGGDGDGGCSSPTHPPDQVCYSPSESTERDRQRCKQQEQRYAEQAIRRYNKNRGNKVKYALVEVAAAGFFFEDDDSFKFDVHLNLHVRAKNGPKKHGPPELVFAELWKGKALTSWQILDVGKDQFPGRSSHGNRLPYYDPWAPDTRYCYACHQEIMHPEGSLYKTITRKTISSLAP